MEYLKEFVKVMKEQKRLRTYATVMTLLRIAKIAFNNLIETRKQRRRAMRSVFVYLCFYCNHMIRYVRRYGKDFDFRIQNVIRRSFTAPAAV